MNDPPSSNTCQKLKVVIKVQGSDLIDTAASDSPSFIKELKWMLEQSEHDSVLDACFERGLLSCRSQPIDF